MFIHSKLCVADCFIDLNFAADSSGSINYRDPSNWNKTLQFIVDVVSLFTIGPNDVQVSFVVFSTVATVEWNLTQYQDKASLITAIMNVPYLNDRTNLNDALYLTRTQIFASGGGTRPNANKITIILTDGVDNVPTNGTELTIQNATACKNDGIRLIAVGVSDKVSKGRMLQVVSDNTTDYYHVNDFVGLTRIVDTLKSLICVTTMETSGKHRTSLKILHTPVQW